jgi:hypothetical protein
MNAVLTSLVILLVTLIVLLAVPIELAFDVKRIDRTYTRVKIRWLFGLIRFSINRPGTGAENLEEKSKARAITKTKKQQSTIPSSNLIGTIKQSAFRRRVYRFVRNLLRLTHSHDIYFRLRIGLGDAANTGRLWIFLGPISALAANTSNAEIRIEPEFINTAFEFDGRGAFRLMPLEFITLLITFLLPPPDAAGLAYPAPGHPQEMVLMNVLKTGTPLANGKTILLPIERIVVSTYQNDPLLWLTGFKEPYAVIVRDDTGTRAFNTDAIEVPIQSLRQVVPDLDSKLATMAKSLA